MFTSLRSRLILLVLLAVLPALALALYTGLEQRNQAALKAEEEALRLARLVANHQANLIEGGEQLLIALARLPAIREADWSACDAFLAILLQQYAYYANLGVAAPNGDLLCSALPYSAPVSYADREWLQDAVKTGHFVIGDFVIGRLSGKAILPMAYPGLDKDGQVQYVVFTAIDLAWLNQFAAGVQLPEGSVFTMIDHHGAILARYPDPDRWVGQIMPEAPIIEAILNNRGGDGAVEEIGVDGVPRLYVFTALGSEGELSYQYVSIGIPTKVAYAEANRMLAIHLAGLGISALAALAVAWGFGNVFILRRVNSLLRVTQRLAQGDLNTRTGIPDGNNELSQLARAFDRMVEALEQREVERMQAEERYRQLFETMMNGFALHEIITDEDGNPYDYRFLEVNPAFEKITGLRAQEVVGKTVREVLPGIESYWIETHGQVALSGAAVRFENYAAELGKYFEVFAYSPQERQFATLFVDITERKRAQNELLRTNRALKTISECNQALVRAEDEASLLNEICQILVNTGGYRMVWVGYAAQDEGRVVRPIAHAGYEDGYLDTLNITWADAKQGNGPIGAAIRTGMVSKIQNIQSEPALEPWRADALQRGYSACIALPLLNEGKAFGVLNIYSEEPDAFEEQEERLLRDLADDLTYGILALRTRAAHQQAEQALRASEARYRTTLDNMLEGCQIIDFDWRYLYVNDAVARQGHKTKEELLGRTMMEAYPGIEKTNLFSVLQRCMTARTPHHMENEFIYPDGTSGWFELGIQPVPEGLFIFSVDITERKRTEEQIRQNVIRAQALADISRVIAEASLDYQHISDVVVKSVSEALGDSGVIALTSEDGEWLYPVAYYHPEPDTLAFLRDFLGSTPMRLGEGMSGRVAQSGQPILIAELSQEQIRAVIKTRA